MHIKGVCFSQWIFDNSTTQHKHKIALFLNLQKFENLFTYNTKVCCIYLLFLVVDIQCWKIPFASDNKIHNWVHIEIARNTIFLETVILITNVFLFYFFFYFRLEKYTAAVMCCYVFYLYNISSHRYFFFFQFFMIFIYISFFLREKSIFTFFQFVFWTTTLCVLCMFMFMHDIDLTFPHSIHNRDNLNYYKNQKKICFEKFVYIYIDLNVRRDSVF